jgi:CRISPR-associated endonuclease Csn1
MRETFMQGNTGGEPLTFGFDIGIASVGWAVLSPTRIVDLGVRCFDKAETAKEGESLNLARRQARLMRRRLRRRAWRLTKLTRLLKHQGLIADAKFFTRHQPELKSAWQLRVEGLDRLLGTDEWARVIYHLCKHRGFHWVSRAEEKQAEGDAKGEGGKVKQGLAATKKLMQEKGYRTAAEMVLAEFPEAQRNKRGDYGKALARIELGRELTELFKQQRALSNPHAGADLELAILGTGDRKSGLFWEQKPPLAGADLLKMLGKCTFERDEYRAPKASFTAERHVWLTRLNNTRIVVDGVTRGLNEAERAIALPLPYQYASELSYKQLRTALVKAGALPDSFRFTGLAYPSDKQAMEAKAKDPEGTALTKLPAYQALRKLLKDKGLETEWQGMAGAAQAGSPEQLDQIAWVLSVFKDDDEVTAELLKLALPGGEKMIDALLDIRFDKFHALSLKALRAIVPHMEGGLRYDEACERAGYHHSQLFKVGAGESKYLPPFYSGRDRDGRMVFDENMDIPRNPVVLRSLNQARKVINALIRRHGQPHAVHIEMARDLSRPMDERSKVKKLQDEFRERNEKDRSNFAAEFDISPRSREFERYQLYREQQGKCAYSLEPLDIHRVLHETGYAEVDHALPYSRSFDDSKNNKVLALTRENRNKGNQTPYEYLDGASNSERWRHFVAYVEGNKIYRLAKRSRLLRKDFGAKESQEFRDRNLNDTRYICKFFKNYVEQYLQLAKDSDSKRCVVLSGQLTAFLRARWGLIKVRSDSDRHHALDAAVVAACSHGMVQRLSNYSRRKELEKAQNVVDMDTGEIMNPDLLMQLEAHFPEPWAHFRHELNTRLHNDNIEQLREDVEKLGSYPAEVVQTLKPLFVSRAPQRRNGGAAHKDTIYAQPERLKASGGVTQKVALTSLSLKDLDKLVEPHRNERLYSAIKERLEAYGGKGDKAFPLSNPLRKPDRNGNPTGPVVRTVTMEIGKLSGIPIRGGVAKNDSMLRVDVFTKAGKFHLVPVYVHHGVAKALPDRAIIQGRDEDEWTLIDGSFDFCFSLYPNDLVRIQQKGKEQIVGYYSGCDRSDASVAVWSHDRNAAVGTDGLIRKIGVKTALSVEKFNVDVLGNIYSAPKEARHGLA